MANRSIERRPTGCADWSPLMSDVERHETRPVILRSRRSVRFFVCSKAMDGTW